MSMALSSPGFWGAGAALRILGPGYTGRLLHSRAGTAMTLDPTGTFQSAAANTPRFEGAGRGLLVEEARSNMVRNPRGEGGAAGSAELPANWAIDGTVPVTTIMGQGIEDGLPYTEIRFRGSQTFAMRFEALSQFSAVTGQIYTSSFFARLTAGSLANVVLQNNFFASNGLQASVSMTPGATPLGQQRTVNSWLYTGAPSGLANRLRVQVSSSFDFTLRLAAPQLEIGNGATSPMMPPAGAPATTSRAADLPSWWPPAGFGTAGTVILSAALAQAAAGGADQGLMQMDDGTDANRVTIRNTSGGSAIHAVLDSCSVTLATLAGGVMTPGVAFRAALAWEAGSLAFCVNGGAVQTASVTLPPSLSRMLVGHGSAALGRAANGVITLADHRCVRLPNATLQALSAAG